MKKTLSIALVAAMTLSAVGMTAFAGTEYNAGKVDPSLEKLVAKVDVSTQEKFDELDVNQDKQISYEEALNMNYTELNTPTKTFKGWAATSANEVKEATTDDSTKKGKNTILTAATGTFYVPAIYEVTTNDSKIKENMAALGDNGQSLKDKLAELDKQYNADGKNAYNETTKKDVEGRVNVTEYTKGKTQTASDEHDDYFMHAVKVAGVSDDAKKTHVFDVRMANGKLYSGKNQRVTFELSDVDDGADLNKFGVSVYHIVDWCKAVKVKNVYTSGNKVYIWTDSFSPYVVTLGDGAASTGAADASNPSTGDFSAVPVALLAAAALGATGFVAYKKRKAE